MTEIPMEKIEQKSDNCDFSSTTVLTDTNRYRNRYVIDLENVTKMTILLNHFDQFIFQFNFHNKKSAFIYLYTCCCLLQTILHDTRLIPLVTQRIELIYL